MSRVSIAGCESPMTLYRNAEYVESHPWPRLLTDRNSHRAYPTKILSRSIVATLCCTSGNGGAERWW